MATPRDLLFGQIALERGFITKQQLDESIRAQEARDARQIGLILLEKGHISEEELEAILAVQRERLARTAESSAAKLSDHLYGRLVVSRKLATQRQVNECLRHQALIEEMGILMRLGEILARKGYLTQAQADEVFQYQKQQLSQFGAEG
ncbi:MAG: hypothetical protein L0216_16010 [Planctomycetales bacterium]|nr:hypothetical protein [Planctomycetales bacterium]